MVGSPLDEVLEALQVLVDAQAETPVPRQAGEGNFRCERCEDCSHCRFCTDCTACEDCTYCERCSGCSACTHCKDCERCRDTTHSRWSSGCKDSSYMMLCLDCEGCVQCFACVGLSGAEFCVLNEKLPRKAYFSRVAALRAALEERESKGWVPPWSTASPGEDDDDEPEEDDDDLRADEPEPEPEVGTDQPGAGEAEDGELAVEVPAASLRESVPEGRARAGRADVTVDIDERSDAVRRSQPTPWTFADARRERETPEPEPEPEPEVLPQPPPFGTTGSFEAVDVAAKEPPHREEDRSRDRYGWSAQAEGTPVHLDWPALEDRASEGDRFDARRPWSNESPYDPRSRDRPWDDDRRRERGRGDREDERFGRERPWGDDRRGRDRAPKDDREDERFGRERPWGDDRGRPATSDRERPWGSDERRRGERSAGSDRDVERGRDRWADERARDDRGRERPWGSGRTDETASRSHPWSDERAVDEPAGRERSFQPERPRWNEPPRSELRTRRTREGIRRVEPEPEPARGEQHPTFEWPRAAPGRERDPRADDLDWRRRETAASPQALPPPELESMADLADEPPERPGSRRLDAWSPYEELRRSRLGPDDQTEPDAPVARRGRSKAEVSDAAKMPEVGGDAWGDDSPERSRTGLGSGRRPQRPRADTPRKGLMRGRAPARPPAPAPAQADAPSLRRARRPARTRDESPTAPYPTGEGEEG